MNTAKCPLADIRFNYFSQRFNFRVEWTFLTFQVRRVDKENNTFYYFNSISNVHEIVIVDKLHYFSFKTENGIIYSGLDNAFEKKKYI